MDDRLKGRAAIVTGAADGVGRGIALRFGQAGASVVVADVNDEKGLQTVAEITNYGGRAIFKHCDVTQKEDVEAMVSACLANFSSADILVNNAYRPEGFGRIERFEDETFKNNFDMNLYAAKWSMEAAFPHMKKNAWGRVINICSLNGVNAHMGSAAYNASKEALRSYTRTAAREWAPLGICANIICPAAYSAAYRMLELFNADLAASTAAANPMGRMGDPAADIGGVAVFLASEDARYVTGNTLFVDGGSHINGASWAPDLGD